VSHDLAVERTFDAAPEVVFDSFVDPAAQHALYADAADWIVDSECDLRVGGQWWISFGPPGKEPALEVNVFDHVDRPHRLRYRSTMTLPDGSSFDTVVEVDFAAEGTRTRMRIVQRRFPSAERRDEFRSGWGSIVDQLEHVVRARSAGR
jgi:uncharacterized protein YndB with AHSA1/START domain